MKRTLTLGLLFLAGAATGAMAGDFDDCMKSVNNQSICQSAVDGNVKSMEAIALSCLEKQDMPCMLQWAKKGADNNSVVGMFLLGQHLVLLPDTESQAQGFVYMKKAAEAGHTVSMKGLGDLYSYGVGTKRSEKEAAHWYREAIDHGIDGYLDYLKVAKAHALSAKSDDAEKAEFIKYLQKASEKNIPEAQLLFGGLLKEGKFVKADPKAAMSQFAKVGAKLSGSGYYEEAKMILKGLAEDKNEAHGLELMKSAAQENNGHALNYLGSVYAVGLHGEKVNNALAFDYFKRSAETGLGLGEFNLALSYAKGLNTPVASSKGEKKGDVKGNTDSQKQNKDAKSADKAGNKTNNKEEYSDTMSAYIWFRVAAICNSQAVKEMQSIASALTEDEIFRGNIQADQLNRKYGCH